MHLQIPIAILALCAGKALSHNSTLHATLPPTTSVKPPATPNPLPPGSGPVTGKPTVWITLTSTTTVAPITPPFANSTSDSKASIIATVPPSLISQEGNGSGNHTINTVINKQYCVLICPSTFPLPSALPTLASNTTAASGGGNASISNTSMPCNHPMPLPSQPVAPTSVVSVIPSPSVSPTPLTVPNLIPATSTLLAVQDDDESESDEDTEDDVPDEEDDVSKVNVPESETPELNDGIMVEVTARRNYMLGW
ncbi:hypothetical protein P280DRAFT_518445 [Massarina eburnea CBS 473.64]|uniref:Uncharacterized protein n=1 Tax=Massarina eburnea CBS 473.64 TaxID=1395130 RepID=A0A6A6S1B2_9PLEO|nr:hypothetical protein P280DRAFT_518445 [Massarina eburnea CBS 473.64]